MTSKNKKQDINKNITCRKADYKSANNDKFKNSCRSRHAKEYRSKNREYVTEL